MYTPTQTHQKTEIPPPYDGSRKGVLGVVLALTAISRQLDYLIRNMK